MKIVHPPVSDFIGSLLIVPLIIIFRFVAQKTGAAIYVRSPAAKNKIANPSGDSIEIETKKFGETFWKCLFHTFTSVYGIVFFLKERFLYFPYEYLPSLHNSAVYWYLMIQTAYYIWATLHLPWDVKRKGVFQTSILLPLKKYQRAILFLVLMSKK